MLVFFRQKEPVTPPFWLDTTFVAESNPDDAPIIRRKPAYTRWDGKIVDWGFRSGDLGGGAQGGDISHWWYWWDNTCQERFDELWSKEGDDVADDLADRYWFSWPWLIGPVLATTAPTVAARVMQFAKDPSRPGPEHAPLNPSAVYDQIATWGSFQVVRRRRNWQEPSYVICPVCGVEFWNGSPAIWMIRRFGRVHSRGSGATRRRAAVVELLGPVEDACGSCPMRLECLASRVTWFRGCGL